MRTLINDSRGGKVWRSLRSQALACCQNAPNIDPVRKIFLHPPRPCPKRQDLATLMCILVGLIAMLSCSESPSKSASPQANNDSTPSTSSATTVVAATPESITTTDGTYTVKFSPSPDPIPVNDFFAVRAIVYDNQGNPLTDDDIDLYVDAAMPHHGHGMNHESTVVYDNDGRFMATDLLFHMTGYWEIYFDITRDGRTERAQTSVTIE